MKSYNTAIAAALDAAAPDGPSWLKGRQAFHSSLMASHDVEQALNAALDAAAPDRASWLKGQEAFHETQSGSFGEKLNGFVGRVKSKAGLRSRAVIH